MFKFFFVLFIFLSGFLNAFSLKEGFIKTLANNPDVLVRENELKKIEYDMDIAKGLFYPTINFKQVLIIQELQETHILLKMED